jgi:hypothetical protein
MRSVGIKLVTERVKNIILHLLFINDTLSCSRALYLFLTISLQTIFMALARI